MAKKDKATQDFEKRLKQQNLEITGQASTPGNKENKTGKKQNKNTNDNFNSRVLRQNREVANAPLIGDYRPNNNKKQIKGGVSEATIYANTPKMPSLPSNYGTKDYYKRQIEKTQNDIKRMTGNALNRDNGSSASRMGMYSDIRDKSERIQEYKNNLKLINAKEVFDKGIIGRNESTPYDDSEIVANFTDWRGKRTKSYYNAIENLKKRGVSDEQAEGLLYYYSLRSDERKKIDDRDKATLDITGGKADNIGMPGRIARGILSGMGSAIAQPLDSAINNFSDMQYDDTYIAKQSGLDNTSKSEAQQEAATKGMNKVGTFFYQNAEGLAEMGTTMVASGGNGALTNLMFAGRGADDAYNTAINNGADQKQAAEYGLLKGFAEYLIYSKGIPKLKSMTPTSLAGSIFKDSGTMFSMSVASQAADAVAQTGVLGDKSTYAKQYDNLIKEGYSKDEAKRRMVMQLGQQLGKTAIGSLFSGAVIGTGKWGYSKLNPVENRPAVQGNDNEALTEEEAKYYEGITNEKDLKRRYYKYSKEYHPDSVISRGMELNEDIINKWNTIKSAYEKINKNFDGANGATADEINKKVEEYRAYVRNYENMKNNTWTAKAKEKLNSIKESLKKMKSGSSSENIKRTAEEMINDVDEKVGKMDEVAPQTVEKPVEEFNAGSSADEVESKGIVPENTESRLQEEKIDELVDNKAAEEKAGVPESVSLETQKEDITSQRPINEQLMSVAHKIEDNAETSVQSSDEKVAESKKVVDISEAPISTKKAYIPDAVKMTDEEIHTSVQNGSYHPKYTLGNRVVTNKGTGYIQEIVKTGSESRQVIVNYDNGSSDVETMDAFNDIVDNPEEAMLYSFAVDFGYNGANTFIQSAPKNIGNISNINKYSINAHKMYDAGRQKLSFEDTFNNGVSFFMSEYMAQKFYNAGVMDRKNTAVLEMSKNILNTKQNRTTKTTQNDMSDYKEINIESVKERLSDGQKNEIEVIERVKEATGIKIKFFESKTNENGRLVMANGFFDRKNNVLWIDINAGRTIKDIGRTTMVKTASHELTHYIAKWSEEQYKSLEKFVLDRLKKETGKEIEQLIKEKMKQLNVGEQVAREEITADACEMMLKNTKAIEQLAKENKKLFDKIKEWIHNFVEAVKKAFEGVKATSKEAKQLVEYIEEIQEKWDNALVDAVKKETTSQVTHDKNIIHHASENKSMPVVSDNDILQDKENILNRLRDASEVTEEKIKENILTVSKMKEVAVINEDVLKKYEGDLKERLNKYFESFGNVIRSNYGDIECGKFTKKNIMSHNINGTKLSAISAVPEVIRQGKAIQFIANRKNRGTDNIVIAAPVILNNVKNKGRYLIGASIRISESNNALELYEVYCVKEGAIDTSSIRSFNTKVSSPEVSSAPSILSLLKKISEVNIDNKNGNILYSYGGRNSNNVDLRELQRANEMEKEGKSFEEIFKETGWFRGIDNIWKYEIDDSKMTFNRRGHLSLKDNQDYRRYEELSEKVFGSGNISKEEWEEFGQLEKILSVISKFKNGGNTVGDYVQHDELFKQYPFLKDVKLEFVTMEDNMGGWYDGLKNTIFINKKSKSDVGKVKRTMLHELQHAIQKYEGFARGANVEYWKGEKEGEDVNVYEKNVSYIKAQKKIKDITQNASQEFMERYREINRSRLKAQESNKESDWDVCTNLEKQMYENPTYSQLYQDLEDARWDMASAMEYVKEMTPEDMYKNTAGEIEAWDVSGRMNYSKGQRRGKLPNLGDNNTVFANNKVYSFSMRESFSEQVDKVLNKQWEGLNALYVTETPEILQQIGLKQLPMLYTKKHLEDALKPKNEKKHYHGLTEAQIKKMPEIIEHPAIVIDSLSRNDSIVVISDICDNDNLPIIVSVRIDGNGVYELKQVASNFITGMYGRKGISALIDRAAKDNKILYINNKKSHNIFSLARVQFPYSLNNYDFDTIIHKSSYVVNNKSAEGKDIRHQDRETSFSVREPVEVTRDLIAVHNLSEKNLLENLKLGGFPMPSIAITKASHGFDRFGDISVVFNKDTIDPRNSDNKVYSGDAWTPVFPDTEWKINDKGLKKLANTFHTSANYIEQFVTKPEDAVDKLKEQKEVKRAFLEDKGVTIERKTKMPDYRMPFMNNENVRRFITDRNIGVDDILKNKELQKEISEVHIPVKDNEPRFKQLKRNMLISLLKDGNARVKLEDDFDILKGRAEQIFDNEAFENDTKKYLDSHDEEYTDYVERALDGVYENKYLVKPDVERYNKDGSLKSFRQLHMPYNLENIVRLMKKQDKGKGGGWFGGAKNLKGAAAQKFEKIEQIKENKDKIQNMTDEEWNGFFEGLDNKILEIDNAIINNDGIDMFARMRKNDWINEIMVEAFALNNFNENSVKRLFKKEGIGISDKIYDMMKSLRDELENIPVQYFEAKPERAVGLNEIAYVVIPDSSSEKLKNMLSDKNIQYKEYSLGNENERKNALNSMPEILFSSRENVDPDYSTDNGIASYTEDRLEDLYTDYAAMNEDYSQAYLTRLSPEEFLKLTTEDDDAYNRIISESTNLDKEKLRNNSQPIYLRIYDDGEVKGHEGRHRMAALMDAGITSVPVVLIETSDNYGKEIGDIQRLDSQDFSAGRRDYSVKLEDSIPITKKNDSLIREKFLNDDNEKVEVRFSLRNVDSDADLVLEDLAPIIEENEKLKRQNELLEQQFIVTKGHKPKVEDVTKMCKKILKKYSSDYNLDDMVSNFKNIIDISSSSKFSNYAATREALMTVAESVLKQSKNIDMVEYEQYAPLRKTLRTTRIVLNEQQMQEAQNIAGSYNDYRKKLFGKVKLVKEGGIQLDSLWQELSEKYPEEFSRDTSDVNQVHELMDIVESIKQAKVKNVFVTEQELSMASYELMEDMMQEYFSLPTVETFADARIHELQQAREEYRQGIDEARKSYNEKYQKKVYKDKIKKLRNNLASKITNKKSVPFGLVDKTIDVLNEIYMGGVNLGNVERKTIAQLMGSKIQGTKLTDKQAKEIVEQCNSVFMNNYDESMGRSEQRVIKWLSDKGYTEIQCRDIINVCHDNYFSLAATNKVEKQIHRKLKMVQDAYSGFRKEDVPYEYAAEYDDRLNNLLEDITDIVQDKAVTSLNNYELERLYNALKEVSHVIINATQQIDDIKGRTNLERGTEIINEIRSKGESGKNAYKTNNYVQKYALNSQRYINSITGWDKESPLAQVINPVLEATRTKDKVTMNLKKPFDELTADKEYDAFTGKKKGSLIEGAFFDKKGNPLTISHSQLVQIIMTWERNQGKNHLKESGATIYDVKQLLKGKLGKAVDMSHDTSQFTEKTINRLREHLTEYDKKWIKAARNLFRKSGDLTNEVTMKTRGVPVAMDPNYCPIISDRAYLKTDSSKVKIDATLEGQGRLKETTPHASNPVVIMGIEKLIDRTISESSSYYAYVIPIKNARKALNVTLPGNEDSVRKAVREVMGEKTMTKIDRILDEIETGRAIDNSRDEFQKEFGFLYSNFVASALNTNISVSIKQFASYPTAMAYIKERNLLKALAHRVDLNEIDRYTGAHYKRRSGLSHMELDIIQKSSKLQDVVDKLPNILNGRKWITAVDCFTTARLWNACKYQIKDEGVKPDTEEFWQKTTELYHKVLEETQPMYDVQYRTGIQKTNNVVAKMLSMFKTQQLQTFGMLYDAHGEMKAAGKKYRQNKSTENKKAYSDTKKRYYNGAVRALINSAVLFSVLTLIADFATNKTSSWRDEKTGEITIESVLKGLALRSMGAIVGIKVPIVGDRVYQMLTGDYYDMEEPTLTMINETYQAVNKLYEYFLKIAAGKGTFNIFELMNNIETVAYRISSLLGTETKNISNIIKSAVYYAGYAVGNKDIENALGYQYKNSQLYAGYYNAVINGDTEKAELIKTKALDGNNDYSKFDTGIKNILINNDTRVTDAAVAYIDKDYDTYERLINDIASSGFKKDIAIKAVESVINSLTKKEGESNKGDTDDEKFMYSVNDLVDAIMSDNKEAYDHIMNNLISAGKEADKLESSVKTKLKARFKDGNLKQNQAEQYLKDFLGYDNLKVYQTINNWNNKNDYSDLTEALRNGDTNLAQKYMELLYSRGNGKSTEAIRNGITSALKGEYIYKYYTGGEYTKMAYNILDAVEYLGFDREQYAENIEKWPTGADCYNSMNYYIAACDTKNAQNEIYDLYYTQNKKKSTILNAIESTYKPMYVYMKNNDMSTKEIKKTLIDCAVFLGENKEQYSSKIDDWE